MTYLNEWRKTRSEAQSLEDTLREARKLRADARLKLIEDVNKELIEIKRMADAITEAQAG